MEMGYQCAIFFMLSYPSLCDFDIINHLKIVFLYGEDILKL